EPAIRPCQAGVARTALQEVDADIAGHARAGGELALDGAARRHREILGKQRLANLSIAIGAAGPAAQRAIPLSLTEILGCHEAAFPEAEPRIPGFRFIVQEAAFGRGLEIHRKALLDELLVQAHRLALDGAKPDVPFLEVVVGAEIVAADGATANQSCQLVARVRPAAPRLGLVVDADLVEFRRVDPVEPVSDVTKLERVAVADHGIRSPARTYEH